MCVPWAVNWESLLSPRGLVFGVLSGTDFITDDLTNGVREYTRPGDGRYGIIAGYNRGRRDVNVLIDALEGEGLVSILAEPNLTAVSGETASFLAGGEFPIPVSVDNDIAIEYRPFGVSLSFTATLLADNRISMRVRPEVSELSNENGVELNGFEVPALITRRAETTVEISSGQTFAVAGLFQTRTNNAVNGLPDHAEPADHRRAVPFGRLPAQSVRAGDHDHPVSGRATGDCAGCVPGRPLCRCGRPERPGGGGTGTDAQRRGTPAPEHPAKAWPVVADLSCNDDR